MNQKQVQSVKPVLLVVVLLLAAPAAQQRSAVPPVSWTCPMHPDVVEGEKGTCRICKMDLVPVRLDTLWSCPVHSVVQEKRQGKCPICRRDLVQVTFALSWTCPDHPETNRLNPGRCPDGSEAVPKYTTRAHGNHNPQHGGIFFMAPDNWHHLEGTYPEDGTFRLHVYDDYSKPLPLDRMKQVAGRVVTKETYDSATRTSREIAAYPLTVVAGEKGRLEAKIERLALPAQMTAKVKFTPDGPEHRFDFTFPELSRDRGTPTVSSGTDPTLLPVEIPDTTGGILTLLGARARAVKDLIERGVFAEMYVPAFQAKDLALALDLRIEDLPSGERASAAAAIERLVRSAWQLDAYGDVGNRDQIHQAYAVFSKAASEIESAFSPRPRP